MEALKQVITLAAALLAFTVSFRPTLKPVDHEWLVWVSWISLGLAIITGIGTMMCWERFYLSYRHDARGEREDGEKIRDKLLIFLRVFITVMMIGFAVGTLGIGVFAAANIRNIEIKN